MNQIKSALTIGAMAFVLGGCSQAVDKPAAMGSGVTPKQMTDVRPKQVFEQPEAQNTSLYGKIIDVQPSVISYCGDWDNKQNGGNISSCHAIEYVILETDDGKTHTLICPYSMAIPKKDATIAFRKLDGGSIRSGIFIDMYLNPKYFTDDDIPLKAEGIILNDGIKYE